MKIETPIKVLIAVFEWACYFILNNYITINNCWEKYFKRENVSTNVYYNCKCSHTLFKFGFEITAVFNVSSDVNISHYVCTSISCCVNVWFTQVMIPSSQKYCTFWQGLSYFNNIITCQTFGSAFGQCIHSKGSLKNSLMTANSDWK